MRYQLLTTPCGLLRLAIDELGLARVDFISGEEPAPPPGWQLDGPALAPFIEQFDAYFAGALREFTLPLSLMGTPFQQQVWQALLTIPYGETISYGEQARRIGNPKAVRAVGAANGRNPLPIVLPCHRVVGQNGSLTGYAGGLQIKQFLLQLESN